MLVSIAILSAIAIAFCVTSPLITIFHELGHALAYLTLTKQNKIEIFIGSHGERSKLNFKIGKLHFFIKSGFPFTSQRGLCRATTSELNYLKKIIILLAGPFLSILVACMLGGILFNTDIHGAVKLYIFALIIMSFASLIMNLTPATDSKSGIDSDGKQLLFTLKMRKVYSDYLLALKYTSNEEYANATEKLLKVVSIVPKEVRPLRLLSTNLAVLQDYEKLEIYLERLNVVSSLNINELINLGYCRSIHGKRELAIDSNKKILELDPHNQVALNNLGYEYIFDGRLNEAESLLNKAIELEPNFGYAYNNLGYIKILKGELEQGRQLIEKSIGVEPDNAYAYKHLGVYYLKKNDSEHAEANFQKAIQLDSNVVMENYLSELETLKNNANL
jgi:tetratricopeptide (TPR) repeat protein